MGVQLGHPGTGAGAADLVRGVTHAGKVVSVAGRVFDMHHSRLFRHPGPYARVSALHRVVALPMAGNQSRSVGSRNEVIAGYGFGYTALPTEIVAAFEAGTPSDPLQLAPSPAAAAGGAGSGVAASLVRVYMAADAYTRANGAVAGERHFATFPQIEAAQTWINASPLRIDDSALPTTPVVLGSLSNGFGSRYPLLSSRLCWEILQRLKALRNFQGTASSFASEWSEEALVTLLQHLSLETAAPEDSFSSAWMLTSKLNSKSTATFEAKSYFVDQYLQHLVHLLECRPHSIASSGSRARVRYFDPLSSPNLYLGNGDILLSTAIVSASRPLSGQ